ncbi:hypothetical protein AB664_33935 [Brucella anthropi]|uniref:Uncharacterized protein n=1 Tax=Brucella anthropi TaxID=529 RepID=A0A656Z542_BRUAN|nr:hypothetical protein AB664_33935 [Brucella anthropi]
MIRFLIKSAIWLSLAFMVMPHFFPADQENTSTKNSAPVQTKAERIRLTNCSIMAKRPWNWASFA